MTMKSILTSIAAAGAMAALAAPTFIDGDDNSDKGRDTISRPFSYPQKKIFR